MKRIVAVTLALMLTLLAAGCAGETDGETKNEVYVEKPQEVKQQAEEKAPDKVEVSEMVLLDEAGVKITVNGFDADELFGPELKLLIENNSGKNLTVQCRNASVNGYMVETMMSVDVVDGKKANEALTFIRSDLEACGIETIADMEVSFHIFTTEDWETYFDSEQIQIKTSAADTYTYTFDHEGDLVYEGKDVSVTVKGLSEDDMLFGPAIVVYIENNGEKDITVQVRDVSVNGFMVEPMFSSDVVAGKRSVDTITFMTTELEENGITSIDVVELSFHIFDMIDWETIVDTDAINLTF